MKIAAIYDIHANLPALEAVLEELTALHVDQILVGGDVLPGPMPCETLDRLRSLAVPTEFILGNGDREVIARIRGEDTPWYRNAPEQWREPVRWSADAIGVEYLAFLQSWKIRHTCTDPILGDILFCHATPQSDEENFTRLTPMKRLRSIFKTVKYNLVVCGHTHMQFDIRVDHLRVVNAGSVGMPFGEPAAYWLLLDSGVELHCTPYNLSAAVDRVRNTNYPQSADFAQNSILSPPTEAVALSMFSTVDE